MKTPTRFSRFAWKEFLRGPLGTPIVLARGIQPGRPPPADPRREPRSVATPLGAPALDGP